MLVLRWTLPAVYRRCMGSRSILLLCTKYVDPLLLYVCYFSAGISSLEQASEEALLLIANEKMKQEYCYISWLTRFEQPLLLDAITALQVRNTIYCTPSDSIVTDVHVLRQPHSQDLSSQARRKVKAGPTPPGPTPPERSVLTMRK